MLGIKGMHLRHSSCNTTTRIHQEAKIAVEPEGFMVPYLVNEIRLAQSCENRAQLNQG